MKKLLRTLICLVSVSMCTSLSLSAAIPLDSCNMNDVCGTATVFPHFFSDVEFTCISACNIDATPETNNNPCEIGFTPTTWFAVYTDGNATLMNIFVKSADFDAPTISLFLGVDDCNLLQQVNLTASNLSCVMGSNGEAEAVGSAIGADQQYFIAIGSASGHTGNFEICVNTVSLGSQCVVSRGIEITARSSGGPLTGPFEPGETVSICLNVNSYTAANNGCQWFQGLIPVFGNGWDPSSFDGWGQPLNTTVNGEGMGHPGNGIYGTSAWDWFADVDYHYDNIFLQPGDFDGNGTYDLCNILYEADCPNTGGLRGGCCNPCWGSPLGTILPPGWFAYGINGSCGIPGPPIRVDWGDGNTCGGGMGPWSFCFDLKVRDYPDCQFDQTTQDLSLTFFTFADGETGAWTGNASICAFDQPTKLTLPMNCSDAFVINAGTDILGALCAGDSLIYQISYPGILNWTWTINPAGYVQQPIYEGENEYVINQVVNNQTIVPKTITYYFIGHFADPDVTVIKRMQFTVYPQIQFSLPPDMTICEKDSALLLDPQVTGGTGNYAYQWIPTGETTPVVSLNKPFPSSVGLIVSDEIGCQASDVIHIKTRPCLGGTDPPIDDDNEPDDPKEPPPPPDGNFTEPEILKYRSGNVATADFHVFPVPTRDQIMIVLHAMPTTGDVMYIIDMQGQIIRILNDEQTLQQRMRIDISGLTPGVYYIHYRTAQSISTSRIVIL